MMQFDTVQMLGKDNVDAMMRSFGAVSKGAQTAAAEAADFAKRSLEQGSSTFEKLAGVRTLDKAVEIQTDFVRTSYQSFVQQATKFGELFASTAKEAFAPLETLTARRTPTV